MDQLSAAAAIQDPRSLPSMPHTLVAYIFINDTQNNKTIKDKDETLDRRGK